MNLDQRDLGLALSTFLVPQPVDQGETVIDPVVVPSSSRIPT